jgi:hypothetical protein
VTLHEKKPATYLPMLPSSAVKTWRQKSELSIPHDMQYVTIIESEAYKACGLEPMHTAAKLNISMLDSKGF